MNNSFESLVKTIAKLRDPEGGCPWDLEQTHESLIPFLIEETSELAHALQSKSSSEIKEELGDVLLQVLLHAQLKSETQDFDIQDVCSSLNEKMIRRHPHVFGKKEKLSVQELHQQWKEIKASEGKVETKLMPEKLLNLSALISSDKIGKKTHKIKFDWENPLEVFKQVKSELNELEEELISKNRSQEKIEEELGDLMFSVVQLNRHLGLNPEITLMKANRKFHRRFNQLLEFVSADQKDFSTLSMIEKENYWKKVKDHE